MTVEMIRSKKGAIARPSREEAEKAVEILLRWIGEDPTREGLLDTPGRVARSYRELFAGYEQDPRAYLERTDAALKVIAAARLEGAAAGEFLDVIRADVAKAGAAIRFVLAQSSISSQIVDNLNASIHLRALLTDLFLLDEALKISGA